MKRLLLIFGLIVNYSYGQVINRPQHDPPIVINDYAAVLSFDPCKNEIIVADATLFSIGDTVLLIQMKGAVIDTSNTSAFGTILDYKNAGNYEMNYISAKSGNKLTFRNVLTRQYDIPDGLVQLVRVPYFKDPTNYNGQYTCMKWDGSKGGVLVLNAKIINLLDDIDITGKGFGRGEQDIGLSSVTCFENNYVYPAGDRRRRVV